MNKRETLIPTNAPIVTDDRGAAYCNHNVLEHLKSSEEERYYAQDMAMLVVTDALLRTMKAANITQADLAERIGKSRSHVSQVLNGRRNMTLTTLADILWACRVELRDLVVRPLGQGEVSREQMDTLLDTAFRTVSESNPEAALTAQTEKPFSLVFPSVGVAQGNLVGA
jgi:transcriptional regulator with XRE-family HTH domain